MKYYSLKKILKADATYNVIFGKRSNGKTYAALKYALERRIKDGSECAYIRRWDTDITGRRGQNLCSALTANHEVEKLSQGVWEGVRYYAGREYLCNYDENGKPVHNMDSDVWIHLFALNNWEHDKSFSFPKVKTIIFDEFISKGGYIKDEFVIFTNVLSTIIRNNKDVTIFMLGNTINKFCPYFKEMGLYKINSQEQGSIDIYQYGDKRLKVAVEYCADNTDSKDNNNFYFAFDNPKLSMITKGEWELPIFPHLQKGYNRKDVMYTFFIEFEERLFMCDLVCTDTDFYIFVAPKTTDIQEKDPLIYSFDIHPEYNYNNNIAKPMNKVQSKIKELFWHEKVFYADNETGNYIYNFLRNCKG